MAFRSRKSLHCGEVGTRFGVEEILDTLMVFVRRINKITTGALHSHSIHTNCNCREVGLVLLCLVGKQEEIGSSSLQN